jgi:hypothetical protein
LADGDNIERLHVEELLMRVLLSAVGDVEKARVELFRLFCCHRVVERDGIPAVSVSEETAGSINQRRERVFWTGVVDPLVLVENRLEFIQHSACWNIDVLVGKFARCGSRGNDRFG